MNCKENFFGLVTEILACPPGNVSVSDTLLLEKKYFASSDSIIANESLLEHVPMKSKTAECTETHKVDLQGESYEVNITWSVENPTPEELDVLENLRYSHKHLIIRMFGDNSQTKEYARYFVYSSVDGYRFEYNENKGVLECKLSILNTNGLQRIFKYNTSAG